MPGSRDKDQAYISYYNAIITVGNKFYYVNQFGICGAKRYFIYCGESTHPKATVNKVSFTQGFEEERRSIYNAHFTQKKFPAQSPTRPPLYVVHAQTLQVFLFLFQNNLGLFSF